MICDLLGGRNGLEHLFYVPSSGGQVSPGMFRMNRWWFKLGGPFGTVKAIYQLYMIVSCYFYGVLIGFNSINGVITVL